MSAFTPLIFLFISLSFSIRQSPYLYPPPGYFFPPPNYYYYPQPYSQQPPPSGWPSSPSATPWPPYPSYPPQPPAFPPFVPANSAFLTVTPPTMMPDPESESSRLLQLERTPSTPVASATAEASTTSSPFSLKFQESLAQASRNFDRVLETPTVRPLAKLPEEDVGSWKSLLQKVKGDWRAA
jgi:hypothetical protein